VQPTGDSKQDTRRAPAGLVQVLVISQHEIVRQQLVAYLRRSASFAVGGAELSVGAIVRAQPDVLVLDLSRVSGTTCERRSMRVAGWALG